MSRILGGWIEFAVQDARTRRHVLQLTWTDHRACTHVVAVFQRSVQNPRQDFHVAMRMHAKPLSGRDDILMQHPQGAELHVLRVVILIERKCESGIQPRQLVVAALVTRSDLNHVFSPSWLLLNWLSRRFPIFGIAGADPLVPSVLIGSFPSKSFSRGPGKSALSTVAPSE